MDGLDCYVIESDPKEETSGYSRIVSSIDMQELRVIQSEFYDRGNRLLKTLRASGYEQYLGRFWRPRQLYMENHQTNKATRLEFSNYEFATGLTASAFSVASLGGR